MRCIGEDLNGVVVAALFHDAARGLALAVEGIGGGDFSVQCGERFEPRGGGVLLAAFGAFLLIIDGNGLRCAVLVLCQGERAAGSPRGSAATGQAHGEGFGVHARDHQIEDAVAGHLVKGARAFLERRCGCVKVVAKRAISSISRRPASRAIAMSASTAAVRY